MPCETVHVIQELRRSKSRSSLVPDVEATILLKRRGSNWRLQRTPANADIWEIQAENAIVRQHKFNDTCQKFLDRC